MDTQKTKVIFRVDTRKEYDNPVDAIFPSLAGTNDPSTFRVYSHIGQHSNGTTGWYHQYTRAALPQEYAALKSELESIGYNLEIVTRTTRGDYLARLAQTH